MSYIRTKDGRIIDTSKIATGSKYMDFATNDESFRKIFKTKPLSKSENLEELCDLFIDEETQTIFHKHNGYVINWKTNMVYSLKEVAKHFHSVKGAIWTDKGLIYVAKMNENGKLELI